ncbi:MAG: photosynthetic complex assembly protein PuhC [Pseudomonadota bacterium]
MTGNTPSPAIPDASIKGTAYMPREQVYHARWPVVAAGGVVIFAVVAILFGMATGIGTVTRDAGISGTGISGDGASGDVTDPIVLERTLYIERQDDGTHAVFDANTGTPLGDLKQGRHNLVRGHLREQARITDPRADGSKGTIRLVQTAAGDVALVSPKTGRQIRLNSFGLANAEAFSRFLTTGRDTQ